MTCFLIPLKLKKTLKISCGSNALPRARLSANMNFKFENICNLNEFSDFKRQVQNNRHRVARSDPFN